MSLRKKNGNAKMESSWSMLTVIACYPTKKVNKAVELKYLSVNVSSRFKIENSDFFHKI
jgi:hypothetical protein